MATTSAEEDKIVKEALRLIDQGWAQLHSQCANTPKRNVIFVLGGTGAGKSTVTQIITGDLRKLHSKPGESGTGLVIVDEVEAGSGSTEGRIGDPRVASKTFLPEYLTCDDELVFVDCPGFNDNRGTHMDIAAMVLIKKISETVDKARFLFVIPASSVTYQNISRNDFLLLCTHATSFVKNLDKAKDSMGLIITKVNNCDPATMQRVEDATVVAEVGRFLEEVSRQQSTSIENRRFIECLVRDKARWALIHYPTGPGPLDGMEHFNQVRRDIREICHRRLRTAPVTSSDFAITLSWDSKYIIAKRLIPHMKGEIDRIVVGLVSNMEAGFVTRFQAEMQQAQQQNATMILVAAVRRLEETCKKLKSSPEQGQTATNDAKCPVTGKVTMIAEWLQFSLQEVAMSELGKLEEQLRLFQQVTEEDDPERGSSLQITNSLNSLKTKLEELHKGTLKMVRETGVRNVEAQIKELVLKITKEFEVNYKRLFWTSLESGDEYGRLALEKLLSDWSKLESLEGIAFDKVSLALKSIGDEMATPVEGETLASLEELEGELEMLLELTEQLNRSAGVGGNILPEFRTVVRNTRTEAREKVRDKYVNKIHGKVQEHVTALIGTLEDSFFQENFYPGLDLETMSLKREMLTAASNNLQHGPSRRQFNGILDSVRDVFRILRMEVPSTEERGLEELEAILRFYDEFLGNTVARPVSEWMSEVRSLQDRIHDMDVLYDFLELAKNTNPNTLEQELASTGEDVDRAISKFLDALRATSEIRRIVRQRATTEDKLLIQNIATYLESGKTNFGSGDGEKMVVKGRNVKFSEFLNDYGYPRDSSVSKVLVLASESVHLDKDVQALGKELTITVIADKWVVTGGTRTIQLSGSDGPPHPDRKAESGKDYSQNGSPGLPGNCGGNGGNFFGIFNEIVNPGCLYIRANGGNGGHGQDGGDGFIGKDGRDAREQDVENPFGGFGRFCVRVVATVLPNPIIYGKSGGAGGDGGDGGMGGTGGYEGSIQVHGLGPVPSLPNLFNERGDEGRWGAGGIGAQGGKHGNDLEFTSLGRYVFAGDATQQDSRRGASGKHGASGGNTSGQRSPSYRSDAELDWMDVEEFRRYIMEECQGCGPGSAFLQLIDSDPGTLESLQKYSLYSLCAHLYNLERCFYRHSSGLASSVASNFIQQYKYFQNRIFGHVAKLSSEELETQKYLLSFLYAGSCSKLLILREHKQSCSTVVNVHLYLKSLSSRIQDLEQVSSQQWRFDHYTAYDNQLSGKITQLKAVIERTSVVILGEIEKKLESSLRQAIMMAREQALLQDQNKSQKSGKEFFTLGKLFEGICTVASCLSFFGTVARSVYGFMKTVPAAVQGIMAAVKSGDAFGNLGKYCLGKLMESEFVRDLVASISDAVRNVKGITKQIRTLLGGDAPEILKGLEGILGKVGKGMEKLEKFSRENHTGKLLGGMEALAEMEGNIGSLIKMVIEKKNELLGGSGGNRSPEAVGKLDKILQLIMTVRSKIKMGGDSQCQVNLQISPETAQVILALERKKQAIYCVILPAIKTILSDLENLESCSNSSATRIVSKWKLKVTMDQLRMHLNGFIEGADLNNHEIVECVAQLNGGISLTIELYEEIGKFEESRELATFIKDMSSTPTPEAMVVNGIQDAELREMVMAFGFLAKTNLFLVDWVICQKAFKQWAFPFAEKWFPVQDNSMTSGISGVVLDMLKDGPGDIETNLVRVARGYIDKYRRLQGILDDYRATAPEIDRIRFNRDFDENLPFYRWSWKEHGGSIGALLLGERIHLKADVRGSPWQRQGGSVKRGAVKFKTVQLQLRCKDNQQDLDDMLMKGYRVTMTHSGRSSYMINGQVFTLQCGSQPEISYSFDKNTRNLVYVKNETVGDYLHSPYTDWTFKLTELDEGEGGGRRREHMERFAREVDLELWGSGCYVDEGDAKELGLDTQFFQNLSFHYQVDEN